MRQLPPAARRKIREDFANREDLDGRIVRALLADADYDEREAAAAKWQAAQAKRREEQAEAARTAYETELAAGDVVPRSQHQAALAEARAEIARLQVILRAQDEAMRAGGICLRRET